MLEVDACNCRRAVLAGWHPPSSPAAMLH
jgi:hypothetical protein